MSPKQTIHPMRFEDPYGLGEGYGFEDKFHYRIPQHPDKTEVAPEQPVQFHYRIPQHPDKTEVDPEQAIQSHYRIPQHPDKTGVARKHTSYYFRIPQNFAVAVAEGVGFGVKIVEFVWEVDYIAREGAIEFGVQEAEIVGKAEFVWEFGIVEEAEFGVEETEFVVEEAEIGVAAVEDCIAGEEGQEPDIVGAPDIVGVVGGCWIAGDEEGEPDIAGVVEGCCIAGEVVMALGCDIEVAAEVLAFCHCRPVVYDRHYCHKLPRDFLLHDFLLLMLVLQGNRNIP
ncbi:unnamed protein product [Sphagnum balticum]